MGLCRGLKYYYNNNSNNNNNNNYYYYYYYYYYKSDFDEPISDYLSMCGRYERVCGVLRPAVTSS